MRVILAAVALACIAGAALAAIRGDWRSFVLFLPGIWIAGGWFIAMMVSASAKVDEMINEDDEESQP